MGRSFLRSLTATGALGLGLLVASGTGATLAQWQDTETLTGATLRADTVTAPDLGCADASLLGLGLLGDAYLTLSPGAAGVAPNSYFIYKGSGLFQQVSADATAVDVDEGTYTAVASLAALGQPAGSAWSSPASNEVTVTYLLGDENCD
jgi:hypothetical protein